MAGYSVVSYSWNFNDVLSAANTSTLNNPTHQFSANGTYTVKLALNYHPCGTDTLKQVINITGLPEISVSGKTTICKGESTVLSFSGASAYTINTTALAQTTAQVQPTITTLYTIKAKDNTSGCSSLKTVTLTVLPCVGLSENNLSGGLKLFPNPNSGVFTFETPEACEIKILNSLGQEVFKTTLTPGSSEINISNQTKGIYLLEWSTKESKGQFKIVFE
jgi:PKD repeat protein